MGLKAHGCMSLSMHDMKQLQNPPYIRQDTEICSCQNFGSETTASPLSQDLQGDPIETSGADVASAGTL